MVKFSKNTTPKRQILLLSPIAGVFFFIVFSSLITPVFKHYDLLNCYEIFNFINSKICHQHLSRSLFFYESNIGLCARCFAFYVTVLLYACIIFIIDIKVKEQLKKYIIFLLVAPLAIDGGTQLLQLRESTFLLRTITGIMAGIGVSIILFPIYLDFLIYIKKLVAFFRQQRKAKGGGKS